MEEKALATIVLTVLLVHSLSAVTSGRMLVEEERSGERLMAEMKDYPEVGANHKHDPHPEDPSIDPHPPVDDRYRRGDRDPRLHPPNVTHDPPLIHHHRRPSPLIQIPAPVPTATDNIDRENHNQNFKPRPTIPNLSEAPPIN